MVWYLSRGDLDPPLGWWSFGNDQGRGTMTPPMVDGPVTAAEASAWGGGLQDDSNITYLL